MDEAVSVEGSSYETEGKSSDDNEHQEILHAESTKNSEDSSNTEARKARYTNGRDHDSDSQSRERIYLEFYGSEMIRQKAPKVMEIADTVAEEWVQDGKFEGLPLGSPLAQLAAAKALRTAKDVEKKLEEKGVFAMAKMGMDYVKTKMDKRQQDEDASRK